MCVCVQFEELKLELQVVIPTVWVLGTEPKSQSKALRLLNHRAITGEP